MKHHHGERHSRRMEKMHERLSRHHGGPGRHLRGRGIMRGFLAENPDCAKKLAEYGVARLREDGVPEDEIRDHFSHMKDAGMYPDVGIDDLLQ